MKKLLAAMVFVVGCAQTNQPGPADPAKPTYGYSSAFIVVEGELLPGAEVTTKEAGLSLKTAIGVMVEQ